MSLWGKLKNVVDPVVKADIERAEKLDPRNRGDCPDIERLLSRYYSVGGIKSETDEGSESDESEIIAMGMHDLNGFARTRDVPKPIQRLCDEWYHCYRSNSKNLAQRRSQLGRQNAAESRADRAEASERFVRAALSNAHSVIGAKNAALQQLSSAQMERERRFTEREQAHRAEIDSLISEIGDLKLELTRAEVHADEQRRARKLDYLSALEVRLKDLEGR